MTEEEMAPARYDGVADWYDEHVAWSTAAAAPLIARLAGRGSGWCLDVGCRTGIHLTALAETGWSVVGVDASADQLRVARRRAGPVVAGLVRADAARLPFRAGSCPLVVSAFTHTDVDDFTNLAREARRVLGGGWPVHLRRPASMLHRPLRRAATSRWCPRGPSRICAAGLADRRPRVGWRRPDQPGRVPAPLPSPVSSTTC